MSASLRPVGYWKAEGRPATHPILGRLGLVQLANRLSLWLVGEESIELAVEDCVDPGWDGRERAAVVDYLARGRTHDAYYGRSTCRLCGKENGCLDRTDGVWLWPDGLLHYVRDHDVKPPTEFVEHVLRGRKSWG